MILVFGCRLESAENVGINWSPKIVTGDPITPLLGEKLLITGAGLISSLSLHDTRVSEATTQIFAKKKKEVAAS
jgi:outer membrane receptor for ferrienterochelin and colicin